MTAPVRGDLLLHHVALVSLAVLLLNDHVLKAAAPGWVTGKLSDVAGLAFFPFLLLTGYEVLLRRAPSVRSARAAAGVTAVAFAAVKLSAVARALYSGTVGLLRYPVDVLVAGADSPVPVVVQPDASDVVAVIACALVVLAARRRITRWERENRGAGCRSGEARAG
ncbi:hypothetical protein [Cellulomonas soli]|uniref:Uncharacterized protein n=1 Tax=Cellulomonas soli TaxID=931535 RepID=A0A512PBT7_9CELL|nr:hypothetical protein [Cellulomonas soli]NYI58261.1 hypothetical protein [Cellulomonas soli]GEP68681.1 hypothetical protein CSO01_13960 [Cellulomonas soli]